MEIESNAGDRHGRIDGLTAGEQMWLWLVFLSFNNCVLYMIFMFNPWWGPHCFSDKCSLVSEGRRKVTNITLHIFNAVPSI